jgi:hypothetical protein
MKKLLSVLLALVLTLSLAAVAMAQITSSISGQMSAGYLSHPGWTGTFADGTFSKGAFFGQYRWFNARFTKEVSPRDDVTAGVVFQIDYYGLDDDWNDYDGGDTGRHTHQFVSPVANFYIVYDPGFAKFTFDAKGREVVMGIASEELLQLNIARRFAKDGEPHIYRCGNELAKQLTVEVPLGDLGKAVAVIGLEQLSDGSPFELVGGFAQFNVGPGTVGLGYQAEMTDASYIHKVGEGYFVIATDFDITDRIRLQADYSSKNDYTAYWRATWMETYTGTPFNIKQHINSALTIDGIHQIKLRLLQDTNDDFRYWLDGSYKLNDTYRVGLNYRNWAFAGNDKFDGYDDPDSNVVKAKAAEASIIEVYGKYEAGPTLTAFYRTDGSFGFIVEIGFW